MNCSIETSEAPDVGFGRRLKAGLKACLATAAYYSGIFLLLRAIHRRLFGAGVRILYYHRVEANPLGLDALGRRPLAADEFDRQLRHLARFWHVIRLEEAVEILASGGRVPSDRVVITFDDGYRDNYTVALPLLEKYKLPATVFVVSGAIDGTPLWFDQVDKWFKETTVPSLRLSNIDSELSLKSPAERSRAVAQVRAMLKGIGGQELVEALAELRSRLGISSPGGQPADRSILSWDELRGMAASELITIGAHTVTHPILTHLNREEIRWEIEESRRKITQELNRPVRFFAYPDGAYNSTAQSVVREAGLVACATKGGGFNPAGSDLTALRRLGAEGLSQSQFALYLAGWEDLSALLRGHLKEWSRNFKRLAYGVLELAGFFPLLRYLNRERITVLLYHGVTDGDSESHLDNLHVPVESFRRQMQWLRKNFTPVSLDQVLAALESGRKLPPRPVLVIFDDAYRNTAEVAWPILKESGIPLLLFVPTDFINHSQSYWAEELEQRIASPSALAVPWAGEMLWLRSQDERRLAFRKISDDLRMLGPAQRERSWEEIKSQLPYAGENRPCVEPRLSWDELRNLLQQGVAIGSHGVTHTILPGLPSEQISYELEASKREIESHLGSRVVAFAYPNGNWNAEVRRLTEKSGYACAFTAQPGPIDRHVDRYLLNRSAINATDSFSECVSAVSGFSRLGAKPAAKILQVGNYPPPQCGWAMQTKLLTEELRRRGAVCEVMNINESRKIKSPEYVDVQNGLDYFRKLIGFVLRGYRPHTHVNGESTKGYLLALAANLAGRAVGRPAVMTFHGGLPQTYFPRPDSNFLHAAFRLLFLSAGSITCDSIEIERAIRSYQINGTPIVSVPCFSLQNLNFEKRALEPRIEAFLSQRHPVFFCFVCFRPEYGLETVLAAMRKFTIQHPRAGFIWLGFPAKEVPPAEAFLDAQPEGRPENLLLLGNLDHDSFMALLSRCFAYLRPHVRDGVSASVLESLALGVPIIAADNGMRPPGVVTYRFEDADDLCSKLTYVVENYDAVKGGLHPQGIDNNIDTVVEWLLARGDSDQKSVHAYSTQN
jgi:peptidoglycan/xylan/chitin deacetylase (PgdA/CDA1 family)/glycosyltransferase involved in cell wall biosynthesis